MSSTHVGDANESDVTEEFIREFSAGQRQLFLSILPVVGNPTDAEEVLQDTNVIVWAKREQFTPGTNFLAWARAIARLETLRFLRKKRSRLRLLDQSVLSQIAEQSETRAGDSELRYSALQHCIEKLRKPDRELLKLRYSPGMNGDLAAAKLNRPPNSVYQSLGRIRRALAECVRLRLLEQGVVSP